MNKKTGIALALALLLLTPTLFTVCMRKPTAPTQSQEIVFPKTGRWKVTGEDSKRWTGDLVIRGVVDSNEFIGYFDWYYSPSGEYVGREDFIGVYDPKSGKVTMTGQEVTDSDRLALGTYQAYLSKGGYDFVSGIWGGEGTPPDYGGWEAKFQTAEVGTDAQEYLKRAVSYIEDGNFDDAAKAADSVIRLTNAVGNEAAAAFSIRAMAYVGKMEYDRAIEDFTATLRTLPDAKIYVARGVTYREKWDYDRAIEDFNTAIQIELDAGMYTERAWAYFYKKDNDQAIKDATTEIQLYQDDSNVWEAYLARSEALKEKGNNDRAAEDFSTALESAPDRASLYNTRAWAYAHFLKKDFDRAIEDASQAIKLEPNKADYYDTRGWAYLGKNDYDNAADNFSKALRLNPNLAESKAGLEAVRKARAAAPAE